MLKQHDCCTSVFRKPSKVQEVSLSNRYFSDDSVAFFAVIDHFSCNVDLVTVAMYIFYCIKLPAKQLLDGESDNG